MDYLKFSIEILKLAAVLVILSTIFWWFWGLKVVFLVTQSALLFTLLTGMEYLKLNEKPRSYIQRFTALMVLIAPVAAAIVIFLGQDWLALFTLGLFAALIGATRNTNATAT